MSNQLDGPSLKNDSDLGQLRKWIAEGTPGADFDLDTDLFERDLVTSLRFVELVLLVEELSGSEITVSDENVNDFRTLRSIADTFLA